MVKKNRPGVKIYPGFDVEFGLQKSGFQLIAGIDEVGRGALAGPIMAAAVIFDLNKNFYGLKKICDSKKITADERKRISIYIEKNALDFALGSVEVKEIDSFGIGAANVLAFERAISGLKEVDFALIDGKKFRGFKYPFRSIVKGENVSFSIAAASILAKVKRDQIMDDLHIYNSIYGFDRHKGYGTKNHMEAIKKHGPSIYHRKSFLKKCHLADLKLL